MTREILGTCSGYNLPLYGFILLYSDARHLLANDTGSTFLHATRLSVTLLKDCFLFKSCLHQTTRFHRYGHEQALMFLMVETAVITAHTTQQEE